MIIFIIILFVACIRGMISLLFNPWYIMPRPHMHFNYRPHHFGYRMHRPMMHCGPRRGPRF